MPTKKIRERLPAAKDMRERLQKNLLTFDKELILGDGLGASTGRKNLDPDQPAGRSLDFSKEDPEWPR